MYFVKLDDYKYLNLALVTDVVFNHLAGGLLEAHVYYNFSAEGDIAQETFTGTRAETLFQYMQAVALQPVKGS